MNYLRIFYSYCFYSKGFLYHTRSIKCMKSNRKTRKILNDDNNLFFCSKVYNRVFRSLYITNIKHVSIKFIKLLYKTFSTRYFFFLVVPQFNNLPRFTIVPGLGITVRPRVLIYQVLNPRHIVHIIILLRFAVLNIYSVRMH